MTNTWDSFIDSLVEAPEPIETKPSRNEKTYPCGQCAGTGLFQGVLIHQTKKQCFSCRGRGYFKTDPRKLQQQREARAAKKEQAIKAAQEANKQTGLLTHFEQLNMISWNDFARSMYEQHVEGKLWTEKQVAVALSMIEKTRASREARAASATKVDLQAIVDLFETAKSSGYKRPVYRAEGLIISLAPDNGANAGALYIKDETKQYLGKVKDGAYYGNEVAKAGLAVIAADPRDAAIRYGQRTGSCACCGRS